LLLLYQVGSGLVHIFRFAMGLVGLWVTQMMGRVTENGPTDISAQNRLVPAILRLTDRQDKLATSRNQWRADGVQVAQ